MIDSGFTFLNAPRRFLPWITFRPGETHLAWGLFVLAVTAALCHFVMLWIFTVFTFPCALLLILRGLAKCRAPGPITRRQLFASLLLSLGLLALAMAAFVAASLSVQIARTSGASGAAVLAWAVVTGLVPVTLLGLGLSNWSGWPKPRTRTWILIFMSVPILTIVIHQCLAMAGAPLTA
jgi:hypothetical protein